MAVYYNIGAVYEIVGRVTNKTYVHSYVLLNKTNNNNVIMEKDIVEQLALNKQIYNCNAQVYNNTVNLKGIKCKLSELPRYNLDGTPCDIVKQEDEVEQNLKLIGKVQNGRSITDYIIVYVDNPDVTFKLDKQTVISLAKSGRIINARAQMNCGEAMLRGVPGQKLSSLKTYT